MGRYYTGNAGVSGKFWFALQGSDAPEKFGMQEDEKGVINYYLDDADAVLEGIDKQYDILGIEEDKRKYDFQDCLKGRVDVDGINNFISELCDKIYTIVPEDKIKEYRSNRCFDRLVAFEDGSTRVAEREKELAVADLELGLQIYNAISLDGYCELEAEI